MNKDKLTFLIPEIKDGGGNRWSINLANYLSGKGYEVEICGLISEETSKSVYKINSKVKKNFFRVKQINKFIKLINFILFIIKTRIKNRGIKTTYIVTDPILSIISFLFYPNKVIRNIAADDKNLFKDNFLLFVIFYKLLLNLSYIYSNTIFFFSSKYSFVRCPSFFKKNQINENKNISNIIISPSVEDIFYDIPIPINKNKNIIKTICLFPRKHSSKGLITFLNTNMMIQLKELNFKKIILVTSDIIDINFDKFPIAIKVVVPKNDNEIIKYLDMSDLFISTSSNEGFSLPPLEAMSRKIPVIMANAGGNLSYGINGNNCLIYDYRHPQNIIKNIKYLLFKENLLNNIVQNGFKTSLKYKSSKINYLWEEQLNKLSNKNKHASIRKSKKYNFFDFHIKYFNILRSLDFALSKKLLIEFIFFPFFIITNFLSKKIIFFNFSSKKMIAHRMLEEDNISICIQDYLNYSDKRIKYLKNFLWYRCGISSLLLNFKSKRFIIKKFLFLSGKDKNRLSNLRNTISVDTNIILTNNDYYDFSAYNKFYEMHKSINSIMIFSNSSLSIDIKDSKFLDEYIHYFKQNKDLGLLGISANSKDYQSLILNNFTPHLQSIFFITSTEILNKVVTKNSNIFPGTNSTKKNKYSIIQNGEIVLSKLVLELGFSIGVVKYDGSVFKFSNNNKKLMYNNWKNNYYLGDARLNSIDPSNAYKILDLYE